MRRNIKRFAACFAAASAVTFGVLGFASCDISMQQESGYKEGRYAVTSGFSSIDIDADGGTLHFLTARSLKWTIRKASRKSLIFR